MYHIAKKVKVTALLLILLSLTLGTLLIATMPIELARDERILTSPPAEVLQLTEQRVGWSRYYLLFSWIVPSSLQSYPAKAVAEIQQQLQRYQNSPDPFVRQQAEQAVRYHSQLAFETVEGQIRKARNATLIILLGLLLLLFGSIFLFLRWLRLMFACMMIGTVCVCMPIKDQPWLTPVVGLAPIAFVFMITWLVRDNPAQKIPPARFQDH